MEQRNNLWAWILALLAMAGIPVTSFAEEPSSLQLNLQPGVTPISRDIYFLHMAIFWICVVIGVIVFGVLIYSLIKHRKSQGYGLGYSFIMDVYLRNFEQTLVKDLLLPVMGLTSPGLSDFATHQYRVGNRNKSLVSETF